jgi:hypothetical protein
MLDSRAVKMRADEDRHQFQGHPDRKSREAHVFREHVDVGPKDTALRARTGTRARDGERGPVPAHATRWTHERAAARAAERVWRDPETQRRLRAQMKLLHQGDPPSSLRVVRYLPLREAVGSNWRRYVAGHTAGSGGLRESRFTEHSVVKAVWKMDDDRKWYLQTCYPQVQARPDQG